MKESSPIIQIMKLIDINEVERDCISVSPDASYPGYMVVIFSSPRSPDGKRSEWYKIEDFVKNNPTLAHLSKVTLKGQGEDLGVVTAATELTLTDKKKKWKKNEFAHYPIWISRGPGEGQTRTILSNSSNTLIIDTEWDTIPTQLSQYVVSYNVHDPQVLGNSLPEKSILKKKKNSAKLKQ